MRVNAYAAPAAGRQIAESIPDGYRHQFGGNATAAPRSITDVNFNTDLMRLATGGGSHSPAHDRDAG